jgi:hypothetical protein
MAGLVESELRVAENLPGQAVLFVEDSEEQVLRFDDAAPR